MDDQSQVGQFDRDDLQLNAAVADVTATLAGIAATGADEGSPAVRRSQPTADPNYSDVLLDESGRV